MAGGFYKALGVLTPGEKPKPALGSLTTINPVTPAAKGINPCSQETMHYSTYTALLVSVEILKKKKKRKQLWKNVDDFYSNE